MIIANTAALTAAVGHSLIITTSSLPRQITDGRLSSLNPALVRAKLETRNAVLSTVPHWTDRFAHLCAIVRGLIIRRGSLRVMLAQALVAWNIRRPRVGRGLSQENIAVDAGMTAVMSADWNAASKIRPLASSSNSPDA